MARRARPEQQLQRSLVQHLTLRAVPGVWWCHVPNGGARTAIEGAIFRSLGVQAGAPDLILIREGQAHGLELKADGGRLTPAQADCHQRMRAAGARIAVARGIDAAIEQLERWGLLRPCRHRHPAPDGWPGQLIEQVAAAPCRAAAEQLLAAHETTIAALPEVPRERLRERLQDTLSELPDR